MFIALNLLILIFGISLLCVAISWNPQRGKSLFVAFVAVTFVAIPSSQLLFLLIPALTGNGRWPRRGLNEIMFWFNSGMLMVVFMSAMVLLMMYTIVRCDGDQSSAATNAPDSGEIWETTIGPREAIGILRRREWAFLIDGLPIVLNLIALLGLLAWSDQRSSSRFVSELTTFVAPLMMVLEPFLLLYFILRDSVGGMSIGRRLTGCRVVNASNGQAADFVSCLMRNLVFIVPVMWCVELAVASTRTDRRRLGDLIANSVVVTGTPKTIGGVDQQIISESKPAAPVKHALDD